MVEEPGFAAKWWTWAAEGRLPWLLVALLVMIAMVRRLPEAKRPRVRLHVTLVLLHVGSLTMAAVQDTAGYDPDLYLIAALAFELFAMISIASTLAFRVVLPRIGWQLPRILIDILTGVVVIVALIAVGKRAGFSVAGLITTSAVLTAVLGFALQDTLGNMMGGIALQLDRSINIGDWITLGPGLPAGRVTEIRWRYTSIETQGWTTTIVPNSMLMKGQVTVLGRRTGFPTLLRRDVDFYVDFRTAPAEVIEPVRAALSANPVPCMVVDPAVQVLFYGTKDGLAWYRVRYWLEDIAADDVTDAAVRMRVYYALRRVGLSFSIPAQTILHTARDEARAKRKTDAAMARRLDAIGKVDVLTTLGEEERLKLAEAIRRQPFAAGEAMTREGDRDDGMYMIVSGEAAVRIGAGDAAREVARLKPGQFFGEMSLVTGEPRSANVVAVTEVQTYRVDKATFEELVRSRPELADAIAEVLTERRMGLDAARDALLDETSRAKKRESAKIDLLGRIRGFFNLR